MHKFHQKPTTYIDQVSINVMNLERSIQFYTKMIGFKVLESSDQTAVLTADGENPLLILEQPNDVTQKEKRTTGLYHFALLLPNRTSLANFVKHLMDARYPFGAADHHVSEAIYLEDLDGNGIEVYRDREASKWQWSGNEVAMATDPLDGDGLLLESDQQWNGLPAETIMGHVHLHVSNLKEAEKFYTKGLLGFKVVAHYPGAIFVADGKYHHHLGLNVWNGEGAKTPAQNSVGLNWYSIVLSNEEKRQELVAQLTHIGASVTKKENFYETVDPAGNVIRLTV